MKALTLTFEPGWFAAALVTLMSILFTITLRRHQREIEELRSYYFMIAARFMRTAREGELIETDGEPFGTKSNPVATPPGTRMPEMEERGT